MNEEPIEAQLDWHFRADAGLERLRRRLRVEARPRPRLVPLVRRFAAVAALLLVTFSLTGRFAPIPDHEGLDVVGVLRPGGNEAHVPARAIPQSKAMVLQLEKDIAPDFRTRMRGTLPKLAEGSRVDLSLEVTNHGGRSLTLHVGGERTLLRLDLSGPGVFTLFGSSLRDGSTPPFLAVQAVKLEPGAKFVLPIPHLIGGRRGELQGVYWDRPGSYSLQVVYRVTTVDDLGRARDLYVRGAPISFEVTSP